MNHTSFDADFPTDRDEDDSPPGRDLAEVISAGLRARGVRCDDLDETDSSHYFDCEAGDAAANVTVGLVDDGPGRQWLAFVEPRRRGLFKKAGADINAITLALHEVLTDDLHVTPQWFTEAQWNDPSFDRGAPSPT